MLKPILALALVAAMYGLYLAWDSVYGYQPFPSSWFFCCYV